MNAGATMERVYGDLKTQILGGRHPPGTRLDPFHLAKSLRASPTPVREALHRLAGERIIDSWHQEGFRVPILAEADLHDLYNWGAALLSLALKDQSPPPDLPGGLVKLAPSRNYPDGIESLFKAVAMTSDNRELRFAIVNLAERCRPFRDAELRVDPSTKAALATLEEDYRFGRWTAFRAKITRFNNHRVALGGRFVAELRPRSDPLR